MLGRGAKRSSRRSAAHRRRGPERAHPLVRLARRARRRLIAKRRRSMTPAQWVVLAAGVPAIGVVLARRRLRVPPAVTLVLVTAAPLAVSAATPRRRWRYAVVGAAYMWSFEVTWELPYENPKLRERLRVAYPVRIDSVIGLGVPPGQRLQQALRDPARVTTLDKVVTVIYASWFTPHMLLAWLLVRHPEYVPRAAGRLAAAYHLTTPFYYLVPTPPPWWASENAGLMDGQVQRVRRKVVDSLFHKPRKTDVGNPWASMPSDHIASAAITAMGLAELGAVPGALGWTYVALASFAVVYLGEHYVIDVLVGLAIAAAIQRGEASVTPLVHRIVVALERVGS
ncbi:MAG: hypothetical protein DLM64_02175 [Solirubrobacterales bacterium]|nr:MAG: hypothetical protein DLM64_02175 [Solirubrobacterales bacterium]